MQTIERSAHGIDSRCIGLLFVTATNPPGGSDCAGFGYPNCFNGHIAVHHRLILAGHAFPFSVFVLVFRLVSDRNYTSDSIRIIVGASTTESNASMRFNVRRMAASSQA
jgi:hypothetical protein